MARVILKPRKARPFWFGHPWVFSGAVDRVRGRVDDGDEVTLCDDRGREIGRGFFNSRSQIRVRVVALAEDERDLGAILRERLERAIRLRRELLDLPAQTNAYRLVHGEGDGIPGLVVDALDRWLVIQVSSLGLLPYLDDLIVALEDSTNPLGILERPAGHVAREEGLERAGGVILGEAPVGPVTVLEAGVRYVCDPVVGQKTGFFSDQRPNRVALAAGVRGREVVDAFCYVGGFGLRMAHAGAGAVTLLDSSAPALEFARRGAELNDVTKTVNLEKGNVLRVFDHWRREGRSFDVVVVDPPALVPRRKDLKKGLRLYAEINLKALGILRPGGVLISCSCSRHVLEDVFDEMLGTVAHEAGCRLQEIYRGGQGPDHPTLLPLEESRYLKVRALTAL